MTTTRLEKPMMIDGAVPIRYAPPLAGAVEPIPVRGTTVTPSGTITRPANTTTYTAGDAVTTSTSSPLPLIIVGAGRITGGSGVILGGVMAKSTTSTTNAQFRLWFFAADDILIPNDNAPWTPFVFGDTPTLIGTALADFAAGTAGGDGIRTTLTMARQQMAFALRPETADILCLIEARAAYAPGSGEQFRVKLDILQD